MTSINESNLSLHYNKDSITIPPIDTAECLGGLSTFYCRMDSNNITELSWSIDGTEVNEGIKQLRQITVENTKFPNGSEESYLYILGLPINDDIYVGCDVYLNVEPYILYKYVTFTVTNPPPPVSNMTLSTSSINTTVVSWQKPDCVPLNHTYIVTVTIY